MPDRRIFETTQLLGALPPEALESLRSASTVRTVARNQVLFRRGDPATELFGIVSGRVAILTRSPDGRESLVAVLDEGSLFGELGLFDDGPRSADARALEPTQVLALDYTAVRAAIRAEPQLLWIIIRVLAQRLRATDEALADAVFLDVPGRSAKRLLELSGGDNEFRLRMTQEDLAALVGASRERVNKALSMFARLGWITIEGRNKYHILDRAALEDRAELQLPTTTGTPLSSQP
jgi:CRP-like cAMP-binding protein